MIDLSRERSAAERTSPPVSRFVRDLARLVGYARAEELESLYDPSDEKLCQSKDRARSRRCGEGR